ncbi:hypothetical protein D477_014226 [Arthrobacter crystallopoietes BAB-32]|uniref:Uncharacterized protein n=1 Tax=Arthrobacter crystallopoietes BAB-32 TaxID=1246476 RepID=N1UWW4_9MICC|nr:hypothetical protein [Arthrobacter crystallopoietes]EMY33565.1 hypothetical protein D477_014226 [Arthrobacter crystallopoietes BAB-32]
MTTTAWPASEDTRTRGRQWLAPALAGLTIAAVTAGAGLIYDTEHRRGETVDAFAVVSRITDDQLDKLPLSELGQAIGAIQAYEAMLSEPNRDTEAQFARFDGEIQERAKTAE